MAGCISHPEGFCKNVFACPEYLSQRRLNNANNQPSKFWKFMLPSDGSMNFKQAFLAPLQGDKRLGTLFRRDHTNLSSLESVFLSVADAVVNTTINIGRLFFSTLLLLIIPFFCCCSEDARKIFPPILAQTLGITTSLLLEPFRLAYSIGKHLLGTAVPCIANAETPECVKALLGIQYAEEKRMGDAAEERAQHHANPGDHAHAVVRHVREEARRGDAAAVRNVPLARPLPYEVVPADAVEYSERELVRLQDQIAAHEGYVNPGLIIPIPEHLNNLFKLFLIKEDAYLESLKAVPEKDTITVEAEQSLAADELMQVAYTISAKMLDDLITYTKDERAVNYNGSKLSFSEALTQQRVGYQYELFFYCTNTYHYLRGGLRWNQARNVYDYPSRETLSSAFVDNFYQGLSAENRWNTLYNDYCRRVRQYVPEALLRRSNSEGGDQRFANWTLEDTPETRDRFFAEPDTQPT